MSVEPEKTGSTPPPFAWTGQKLRAAALIADDRLTDTTIAKRLKVTDRTLRLWKAHPEFAARVKEIVAELGERSLRFAVGRRHRRVQALDQRWRKMKQVIRARAADEDMADVPGGSTGLMVRRLKMMGAGDNAREVEEYEVDTGLLKALLDHEKQAAIETGQWAEKRELSGPNGQPVAFIEVRLNGAASDRTSDAGGEARPGVQLPSGADPGVGK